MQSKRSQWMTLGCGVAFFAIGVWALSLVTGDLRTVLLAIAFAGLAVVAGLQTWRRIKEKKE